MGLVDGMERDHGSSVVYVVDLMPSKRLRETICSSLIIS